MKIAVVGCGAVGSFYGAKLAYAGETVHFLLRSDFSHVRRHGIQIQSPQGDFRVRPKCARDPRDIGPSDLVLIGLKTTAHHQLPVLLTPLLGPQTAVVTLQNGLGNEEVLAKLVPPQQILGGLCFVCLHRLQPGVIRHIDHGQVVLGEFQRWPEPRTHDICSLFRRAGVPCEVTDDLTRARWEKLVWNIPFNGLGVASSAGYEAVVSGTVRPGQTRLPCLTTDQLLGSPSWETLVRELMREVIGAGGKLGLNLPPGLEEKNIARTRSMGAYKPSTVLDFEGGRPLELDSMFAEPGRQAEKAGVTVPRLAALCKVLQAIAPAPEPNLTSATDAAARR